MPELRLSPPVGPDGLHSLFAVRSRPTPARTSTVRSRRSLAGFSKMVLRDQLGHAEPGQATRNPLTDLQPPSGPRSSAAWKAPLASYRHDLEQGIRRPGGPGDESTSNCAQLAAGVGDDLEVGTRRRGSPSGSAGASADPIAEQALPQTAQLAHVAGLAIGQEVSSIWELASPR